MVNGSEVLLTTNDPSKLNRELPFRHAFLLLFSSHAAPLALERRGNTLFFLLFNFYFEWLSEPVIWLQIGAPHETNSRHSPPPPSLHGIQVVFCLLPLPGAGLPASALNRVAWP